MYTSTKSLLIFALSTCFFLLNSAFADVTVSPLGVTLAAEEGGEIEDGLLVISNEDDEAVNYAIRISARLWEADDDERIGPRRDPRGGPDDMDYEWRDDQEDDGPLYDWIDITEFEDVFEFEVLTDDSLCGMETLDLGFEFNFYGNVFDEFAIYPNGYACFQGNNAIQWFYPWPALPSAEYNPPPPPNLLLVAYQDLNPVVAGGIFFWTDQRMAVCTWEDIPHYFDFNAENDLWTFQVIVFANGLVKYQYAEIGMYQEQVGLTVMVGFQNEDRDLGFTIMRNDLEYLEPERAIAFGPPESWITWVEADPPAGEIAGGEEAEITLTYDLENMEADVYVAHISISFDNPDVARVVVPVILSIDSPVGSIEGTITDAANDQPIEGAAITVEPSSVVFFSDEEGNYEIANLPPRTYTVTCTHPDYFDFVLEEVEVVEDETADGSMALLHAEFNADREEIVVQIAPDDETHVLFDVSNDGNAPLTYVSERRLFGGADAEPWEQRGTFSVGQSLEDDDIYGVVFANDQFYVSGENDGDPSIYVLDREGELVETIPQVGEDDGGIRDLAWDGELIWGTEQRLVLGFTPEGEPVTSFEGPYRPITAITWDTDRELLWIASTTRGINGVNTDGEEVAELDRHDLRIYGLAYWSDDPDGFPLYVFNKERDTNRQTVHKINPDNDEFEFVAYLEPENGGNPVGAFITNEYDIYSWVFMDIASASRNAGGDRIDIWQIDARRDWFILNPTEGVIEAGESQEFDLHLNATGLPPAVFEGEIVFLHDGFGGETHIPVTLNVVEGRIQTRRTLELGLGWNMVSVNLQPNERDVIVLTEPLVEEDMLEMMKDGYGHFYNPEFGFSNIPGWFVDQGYLMKVRNDCELTLEGESVLSEDPIDLEEGWQIVSYYPRIEVEAMLALSGIVDQLLIAKDGEGQFYIPEFGFSNMGDLREGQGYQLKMDQDARLIYTLQEEEVAGIPHHTEARTPQLLPVVSPTGANMSLLAIADNPPFSSPPTEQGGIELGVYTSDGILVGSGVFDDEGRCGVAIWGDDPTTPELDGARPGDRLEIVLQDDDGRHSLSYTTLEGDGIYTTDGLWVITLNLEAAIPSEFGIVSVYPNPFNNRTMLEYGLIEASKVDMALYDVSGRCVRELASERQSAGLHAFTLDAANLTSGIYIIQLRANGRITLTKVTLLK